jgi:hypothetical protein
MMMMMVAKKRKDLYHRPHPFTTILDLLFLELVTTHFHCYNYILLYILLTIISIHLFISITAVTIFIYTLNMRLYRSRSLKNAL